MKKIIVIGIVIWLVLALSVGAFAFENEPDGFRDLNWGDPPSEDMISSYYEEDMAMYYLPEDKMFLGDVPLYLVGYFFFEDRFYGAALYFEGEENYDKVETICRQRFGEDEVEEGFYEMTWTSEKAFIFLSYDYIEEEGDLVISSAVITMEQQKTQQEQGAEKAGED